MFSGLNHIEIVVEDTKGMADYLVSIGFALLWRRPSGTVMLRFPGDGDQPYVDLKPNKDKNGNEVDKLGYSVIGLRCHNFDQTYEALKAQGVRFQNEPHKGDTSGNRVVTMLNPEGGPVQIIERL